MNYQFAPHNEKLNHAYNLRAELRTLQAGEKQLFRQVILALRYRWNEILAGDKQRLPR